MALFVPPCAGSNPVGLAYCTGQFGVSCGFVDPYKGFKGFSMISLTLTRVLRGFSVGTAAFVDPYKGYTAWVSGRQLLLLYARKKIL